MCFLYVRRYIYPTESYVIEHSTLVPCEKNPDGTDSCVNLKSEVKSIPIGAPRIVVGNSKPSTQDRMREAERDASAAFAGRNGLRREARIVEPPPPLSFSSNATASPSMPSTPRSIPPSPTPDKRPSTSRPLSSRLGPRLVVPTPLVSQPNPPAPSSQTSREARTRWRLPSGVSARTRQHYSDSEYEFGRDHAAASTASSADTARETRATEITDRGLAREEHRRQERERRRLQENRERREREEQALDEQERRTQDRLQARERIRQEDAARRRREEELRQQEQTARIRREMDRDREDRETERLLETARGNVRLRELQERLAVEEDQVRRTEARRREDLDRLEAERRYMQRLQDEIDQRDRQRERERVRDAITEAERLARHREDERKETQDLIHQLDEIARQLRELRTEDYDIRRGHTRNNSSSSSSSSRWYWGDPRHYYSGSHHHLPPPPPPPPLLPPFLDGERERRRLRQDPFDARPNGRWDLFQPPSPRPMEDPDLRRVRGQEVLERSRRNAAQADGIRVPLSRRNTVQLGGDYRERETRYRGARRRYE